MSGQQLFTLSALAFTLAHTSLVASAPSSHHSSNAVFEESSSEGPDFCHNLDCPKFELVIKTKGYEIRNYASSNWVSIHVEDMSFDKAKRAMFTKLFNYISGQNARNQSIAMTVPVLMRDEREEETASERDFTMYFYISPSVEDPPQPSDEAVVLTSLPQQRVYIKSFGGFAKEYDYMRCANELTRALVLDSVEFDKSYYYTAGYDSPFRVENRHNEVWFMAK